MPMGWNEGFNGGQTRRRNDLNPNVKCLKNRKTPNFEFGYSLVINDYRLVHCPGPRDFLARSFPLAVTRFISMRPAGVERGCVPRTSRGKFGASVGGCV